jgi:hypothetical protein
MVGLDFIWLLLLIFLLGHAGDGITTYCGLYFGAVERNPFFHWLFEKKFGFWTGMAVKYFLVVLCTTVFWRTCNGIWFGEIVDSCIFWALWFLPISQTVLLLSLNVVFSQFIGLEFVFFANYTTLYICIAIIWYVVPHNIKVIWKRWKREKWLRENVDLGNWILDDVFEEKNTYPDFRG